MKLEILHVPDCPNTTVLVARLDQALTGFRDVVIEAREIRNAAEATAHRMTGSPTLLIDGTDPFAVADQSPSLSCRLYVDEAGDVSGAPSPAQLRAALVSGIPAPPPSALTVR